MATLGQRQEVPLETIHSEPLTMVRERLDEATVAHYAEIFAELPPIDLFRLPDGRLVCASGHHRIAAARRLGHAAIVAQMHDGSLVEAADFAASSNVRHGKPLSQQERRSAVAGFVGRHPDWANGRIAAAMAVHEATVRNITNALHIKEELGYQTPLPPDTQLYEIARAPKEQWKPLAEAAVQREWGPDATQAAVQNLKDERLPKSHKAELLAGETDPVRVRPDGQIAALRETVDRDLEKARRTSAFLAYRHALSALSNLALFDPVEIVAGLEPYDRERALDPHGGLERYATFLLELKRRIQAGYSSLEVIT